MKRWLRDPLVHFIVGGLILFVLFQYGLGNKGSSERQIVVDRDALQAYAQFRMKAFAPAAIDDFYTALPEEELDKLATDYVREETLYREALSLGLQNNDYVIRQRLVQKLRFIHEEIASVSVTPDQQAVRDYFDQHQQDYALPASVTLTHVFFDSGKHGRAVAEALALQKLQQLRSAAVPFTESAEHGDRFLYKRNYVAADAAQIADHFGAALAAALFDEAAVSGSWQGPVESEHGFHLLMITDLSQGRVPEFEEVRDVVTEDAVRKLSKDAAERSIDRLVDDYEVIYSYREQP